MEFKYVLNLEKAFKVEKYLESLSLVKDEYSQHGYYTVNSLYFDTPLLDDYYAKEDGLLKRKKIRARIYTENFENIEYVCLEVKKKHNTSVNKERIMITPQEWQKLLKGDVFYFLEALKTKKGAEEKALHEFLFFFIKQSYRPQLFVQYKRKAYLTDLETPIRITLDKEVRCQRFQDVHESPFFIEVAPQHTILEVKFNKKLPWWFKDMVERFDLRRTTFSKYSLSMNRAMESVGLHINK